MPKREGSEFRFAIREGHRLERLLGWERGHAIKVWWAKDLAGREDATWIDIVKEECFLRGIDTAPRPGKETLVRRGISARLRFAILDRDGFRCRYCGASAAEEKLHVDHVIPVAKGGTNSHENLVAACAPCNAGKRDALLSGAA